MSDTNTTQNSETSQISENTSLAEKMAQMPKLIRTFQLTVYNHDEQEDGSMKWVPVKFDKPVIVKVSTPKEFQELLKLYKDCGQRVDYVEINPPTQEQINEYNRKLEELTLGKTSSLNSKPTQSAPQSQNTSIQDIPPLTQSRHQPNINQTPVETPVVQNRQPKIYKIGDIEIKDDNGKIYQKQWMKLSDSEALNLRVINDKNNATVNMNGKHFEMKKWVLVENTSSDDSTNLEENLK